MPLQTPDLLVIGLGPAGSRAAQAAAKAGLDVVALERRLQPGLPVQCAELVPGLIEAEVPNVAQVTVQSVARMFTFVEGAAPDTTESLPGRMIDRAAFDRMLAAEAAHAGARCRYGVAVTEITADGNVNCSDGAVYRPRILIGADGPKSLAGAAIGTINRTLVDTRQITVPLYHPHDATDIFLRASYRGGYGWLFPKGKSANLGIGLAVEERHWLKAHLAALHRDLVAQGRLGTALGKLTGGAIPVGGALAPLGALGRMPVLLAGDAAGLANPVTGAGIASAVQSGSLAGAAAADRLGGRVAALADYAEEIGDIFSGALARAVHRRQEVLAAYAGGAQPSIDRLRAGWIASPLYWAA